MAQSQNDLIKEQEQELAYLRWFFLNADFGPADGDVRLWLEERYKKETGNDVPENWKYE